jgi:aminopeptidase YwaD
LSPLTLACAARYIDRLDACNASGEGFEAAPEMWMRTVRLFITAIISALLTLRPSIAAPSDTRISAERIAHHIAFLASDKLKGRRAGTPESYQAARYIAEQFRQYGLSSPSAGFFQNFTFVASARLGKRNSFQIKTPSGARSLKLGLDYMPLPFSASKSVASEIIFAGYGITAPELQYDSYSGIDASGKIVMIMRGSPDGDNPHSRFTDTIESKTIRARQKGACAIIFIANEDDLHKDALSQLRYDLNFSNAGIPAVVISRSVAHSMLSSSGVSLAEAESRAKKAAPFALENIWVRLKTDVIKINRQSANVVGLLRGSDPALRSQCIIIGAHYDHLGLGGVESLAQNQQGQIHHGADDNASGTSALLELARTLALDRTRIKRSIIFIAFSGEEEGLLGSSAYTRSPVFPLSSTVAMINMDMIGRLRDGRLIIAGAGTSTAWKPLLEKLNSSKFKLVLLEDGYGPSDHQSFYVRDIPVLFFFTGSHEDYHRPSDTADRINIEGVKRIAEFVREIVLEVANEDQRIAFVRAQSQPQMMGRGFRVYLGTVPNYSDQGEGLKLDGVRPQSPAATAGLRAGDVIIKIGNMAIRNVYDYTYALGQMRAGEEVEFVVRRDGKELTLKVTPARRQ